jgi:alpha-tubulin suppressor-like RCC1 family protein
MRAVDVCLGDQHSGAISNGTAYFWGANVLGQLGLGNNQNQTIPAVIPDDTAWRQLAAGAEHSCALDALGQVYCWGGNSRGQLGQGDRTSRVSPTLVVLPEPATQISAKFKHSCAILIDAELHCWGQNKEGQLGQSDQPPTGDETLADGLSPVRIGTANWRAVDTGDGHTCAIQLDGGLWCWGRNSEHELGSDARIQVREPIQVNTGGPWLGVAAGQNHTCGVMQDFTLWCWGQNTGSATNDGFPLGIPGATQLDSPTRVGSSMDWTLVRSNTFHTCALNRGAELWCWGRNTEGQLGTADLELRSDPTRVAGGLAVLSVGRFTTCVITEAGELRCAGNNTEGQLGTGDLERRSTLTSVNLASP